VNWPIPNRQFNCTKSNDPTDSPKNLTYYDVLADPNAAAHKHPEWYYLAKEWITAILNFANGAKFPADGVQVMVTVGQLLEACGGYNTADLPMIYALKEKLGRLNNNIGGLGNVDSQLNLLMNGNNGNGNRPESHLGLFLTIVVPVVAVLIVAVILGFTIYYVRAKTAVVHDKFESEDEEEPLQTIVPYGNMGTQQNESVPLEMDTMPTARDDTSEEER